MNVRQIRHFVTVAEELHFGRAAARLHMSQPPLSISIRKLEETLGYPLLLRDNKSVALTHAGKLFYKESLFLLKNLEEMKKIGYKVAHGTIGTLRIGFTSSLLFKGLKKSLDDYQVQYPEISILLNEINSNNQLLALTRQQIDIGFVHNYQAEGNIQAERYFQEAFVCCLAKDHPLAQEKSLPLSKLKTEIFLLFPHAYSPYYHSRIMALCASSNFTPYIAHEIGNWLTIIEMVSQGFGISLVPESIQGINNPGVVYIPIDNCEIKSETYCIWDKDHVSNAALNFLSFLGLNQIKQ